LLNWSERYHVVGGAVNRHLSQAGAMQN